jgi:predicted SAM-dependent methyltransferase
VNIYGSWNARLAKYPAVRSLLGSLRIVPPALTRIPWDSGVLYHDLRRPLPFADESLEAIYASHLLEHLYYDEARRLLKDCYRALRRNGVLRLVVPDLQSILEEYWGATPFDGEQDLPTFTLRADRVNERLRLRHVDAPQGGVAMRIYKALTDFDVHKMYDSESLIYYVKAAGFQNVSRMDFQRSRITDIAELEHPGRVLHSAGICVEGVKPLIAGESQLGDSSHRHGSGETIDSTYES